eukprot:TRINITY_DN100654_c0_g1_i1.p1 TRINITY_DN100654_c0_g1~~TRINITY_DN100654_c0_g1_i1.p1  ORF type:complete len:478 (+),score=110.65 TRINITY_DN100654_c0_g1_i1:69-1436(+)
MSSAEGQERKVQVKNTFIHLDDMTRTQSDQAVLPRADTAPGGPLSSAADPLNSVDDEDDDDDDAPLQRTTTHSAGLIGSQRESSAPQPSVTETLGLADLIGEGPPGLRVKNTFIHMDELKRADSDEPLSRTKSDPTGQAYTLPKKPQALGSSTCDTVKEQPAEEEEADEEEEEDEDDAVLQTALTYDPFAMTPSAAYAAALGMNPAAAMPNFGMPPAPWGYPGFAPSPFAMPYPYGMPPTMGPPMAQPEPAAAGSGAALVDDGPPVGLLHCFHKESSGFGSVSADFRQFTKGQGYEGRLSVLSEATVHRGGVHRYLIQFTGGPLSKADGVGFVFASRLPCTKNIQKIVSVFLNQRGRICMRIFGDIVRASGHVRAVEIGDWVEMSIDLERSTAIFKIWPCNPMGWGPPMAGKPSSIAEFNYGKKLGKAAPKPVDLTVGHFACVIQNVGVTVTFGS